MSLSLRLKNLKEELKVYMAAYNRNAIIVAIISLLSVSMIIFLGMAKAKRESNRRAQFLHLLKEYEQTPDVQILDAMVEKARRSSFLQKHYGNSLIQQQIFAGHEKKLKKLPLAYRDFPSQDLYARFAKTTLDIGSGQYEKALQEAKSLKTDLEGAKNLGLQSANELRIAFLYQKLQKEEEELEQLNCICSSKEILDTLKGVIFEDRLTIQDYIEHRKKELTFKG